MQNKREGDRNFKLKAFSLAEILIVMTVIGVIATLTMPQLIGGIDEAHYKAGYKKAYSTLANITAILKADDELPTGKDGESKTLVFRALCNNLEVEGLALNDNSTGRKYSPSDIVPGMIVSGITCGDTSDPNTPSNNNLIETNSSPWIIAADGMAFWVGVGGGCGKKSEINAPTATQTNANYKGCVIVTVDVNGLERLPNKFEPQTQGAGISSTQKMAKLTGDRYSIYIAKDGIAAGSKLNTVTGRMLSGEK